MDLRMPFNVVLCEPGLVLRQAQDEALRFALKFLMLSLSKYEGSTEGRPQVPGP